MDTVVELNDGYGVLVIAFNDPWEPPTQFGNELPGLAAGRGCLAVQLTRQFGPVRVRSTAPRAASPAASSWPFALPEHGSRWSLFSLTGDWFASFDVPPELTSITITYEPDDETPIVWLGLPSTEAVVTADAQPPATDELPLEVRARMFPTAPS